MNVCAVCDACVWCMCVGSVWCTYVMCIVCGGVCVGCGVGGCGVFVWGEECGVWDVCGMCGMCGVCLARCRVLGCICVVNMCVWCRFMCGVCDVCVHVEHDEEDGQETIRTLEYGNW